MKLLTLFAEANARFPRRLRSVELAFSGVLDGDEWKKVALGDDVFELKLTVESHHYLPPPSPSVNLITTMNGKKKSGDGNCVSDEARLEAINRVHCSPLAALISAFRLLIEFTFLSIFLYYAKG